MTLFHLACKNCHWQWKIQLPIWKRARRRYERYVYKFEQGDSTLTPPKQLIPQIDNCLHCAGSGLELAENTLSVNTKHYPRVAIIGGGIGGTALAVACLHRGIPFSLYERDASFDARSQWYGLTLQQASKAMQWFGISSLQGGITSTRHLVHDVWWKIIGEWGSRKYLKDENDNFKKRRNIHIPRQSLRSQLLSGLGDEKYVQWWHCLKNISARPDNTWQLEFQLKDQQKIAQADLVVAADGIRSSARSLLLGESVSPLRYLGCIVILGICPLSRLVGVESSLLDGKTVFQTVNGNERIYMMPYQRDTIMWQLSFPISEQDAITLSQQGPPAMKRESLRRLWHWHSPIAEILSATEISKISGYPVYDREPLDPKNLDSLWNATLLWDAMHPMSPFKWQGANQALLDALDLARNITQKCGPDSKWREKWLRDTLLKDFEIHMIARSTPKVYDSARAVELLHSRRVLHEGDTPRSRGI